MSCLECTECLSLGTYDICCEEIYIGKIEDAETECVLLIKDLSLNSITKQVFQTTSSGEVYLIPNQTKFSTNRTYEVRLYNIGDCNYNNPLDIDTDLSESVQECVSLDFFYTE